PKDEIIDEDKEVKSLVIDETTTLTAKDLWQYKDDAHMINLSLDASNHMVLTDASMAATYQSVAIETKRFETLVLSWNVKQMKDARVTFMVSVGDGTNFGKFQVMGMFKDEQNMSF